MGLGKSVCTLTAVSRLIDWCEIDKVLVVAPKKVADDVYVIGRDSFVWLTNYYNGHLPFDMLVIDELTSFKSPKSQRFKSMKIVSPTFRRVVGLTGTPAPNGLIDLWAQMYCVDMGERLGKVYDGHISGVTEWGIYVEIDETHCEGMRAIISNFHR